MRKYFLKLSMATVLGKNAPKYGALHKICGIKYAVKLRKNIGKTEKHLLHHLLCAFAQTGW